MHCVHVTTPASTANLGPGFDCLALALDLRNEIELQAEASSELVVEVAGEGAVRVPRDGRNLIVQAAERVFALAGRRPPGALHVRAINRVPLGSGMGSSAATVVGGLAAANALVAAGLDAHDLLRLALAMEGHPDNAAAAIFGGLTLVSADGADVRVRTVPVPPLRVVIALPDLRLSTAEARAALPARVPLADAVFNIGRALFTVQALAAGDEDLLRWAMADRLHQPYRQRLIPGYAEVEAAARAAGAAAVSLSGAGPSLVAFASDGHETVADAMRAAFEAAGLACRTFVLGVDPQGVQVSGE